MSQQFDVVTLGEALLLFIANETGPLDRVMSFQKRTAGAETNVAVGLARLGLNVGWASRLGDDSMARYLLRELQDNGVDCSRVAQDPDQRTGFMFKGRVTDGSDPPIEYFRKGSAASLMGPDDLDLDWLRAARHLHATGIYPALSPSTLAATRLAIDTARAGGRSVSFDPNLRPTLWASPTVMRDTLNELAARCDWVLPGIEEGHFLTGRRDPEGIAAHYRERGAKLVIVKLGARGAYVDSDQGTGHVPAFPVARVVDTVGAGDGFAVGVISAMLQGKPPLEAARRGGWIGAQVVQALGDTEGLPTGEQLRAAGLA